MSEHRIPVCVVGVGHLGRHHARLYAENPAADLVAVVDADQERAEMIAAEYGCQAFHTVSELLALSRPIQAASVAVPTVHHREVAIQLLEAGMDVLVEKPLTKDLKWTRGRMKYHVESATKQEGADAWRVDVNYRIGFQRKLTVWRDAPLVLNIAETIPNGKETTSAISNARKAN